MNNNIIAGIDFQSPLDNLASITGSKLSDMLGTKKKEPECEQGHNCTNGCQKDFDCPCQSDHCCSMSESPCGDVEECEFCASKVPDLADLQNDNLNER